MALKHGISTLALGALLLGTPAIAQEGHGADRGGAPVEQNEAVRSFHGGGAQEWGWEDSQPRHWDGPDDGHDGLFEVHVHTGGCEHGPRPRPPPRQHGRYELQTVQRWMPGYYAQVWVPQHCRYKPRRNVTKCKGGYYEQQWVPGRYEPVQEWVWVPALRRGGYGRHPGGRW